MEKPNYNCSQQELYTVANQGWNSYLEKIASFSLFKAKYDETLATTSKAAIVAAQLIPNWQARGAKANISYINLTIKADACLQEWQKLKRYIIDAFKEAYHKTNFKAAGQPYYQKATNYNWDSLMELLNAGMIFILANKTVLLANKNMPEIFSDNFKNLKTDFEILHNDYINATANEPTQTLAKIEANNAIYDNVINMFLDGQEIFKNEPVTKQLFTFDHLINLISGTGTAGIKGYITSALNSAPITNCSIKLIQTDKFTMTDKDGYYQFLQLESTEYEIQVSAPEYQTQTIKQQVKPGTISTLSVVLQPVKG